MADMPAAIDSLSVRQAADRIAAHAQRTPLLHSRSIDALAGARLVFKCENFQRAGAFKFRGACNAVWWLTDAVAALASSPTRLATTARRWRWLRDAQDPGAHGRSRRRRRGKVAAIRAYGATCTSVRRHWPHATACGPAHRHETGATLVHPFLDPT